jgi:electron transfer flavoprotein alpha subunit
MIKILFFGMGAHFPREVGKALGLHLEEVTTTNDAAAMAETIKTKSVRIVIIPYSAEKGPYLAELASRHKMPFIATVYHGKRGEKTFEAVRAASRLGAKAVVFDELFTPREQKSLVFEEILRIFTREVSDLSESAIIRAAD